MTITKASSFKPDNYFQFTIIEKGQKRKFKLNSEEAKSSQLTPLIKDAIKHLDKTRGKNVTIEIGEEENTYTLKHKKITEHHKVGEEIHPLDFFLHRSPQTGAKGEADKSLNRFFHLITVPFRQISNLWTQIQGTEKKQLKLDIAILQEINHAYKPGEKLSRTKSLKYIIKTLQKERVDQKEQDPLLARLETALENSQQIDKLRKNFARQGEMKQNSDYKKVIKSFNEQIKALDESPTSKLLLPAGYAQAGSDEEMFLEISKKDGVYTLNLITQSDKETPYLSRGVDEDGKVVKSSLRYTLQNVSQEEVLSRIPLLVEFQVNPHLKSVDLESVDSTPQDNFYNLFNFKADSFVPTPVEQQLNATKEQGNIRTIISYLGQEKNPETAKRHDLALRLNAFLDVTEKSDQWLKSNTYRDTVLNTSYTLIDLLEQHREEIFPGDEIEQNKQIDLILAKIIKARDTIEAKLPDQPKLNKVTLSTLKTEAFKVETAKEVPAFSNTGLNSTPFKSDAVIFNPQEINASLEATLARMQLLQKNKNTIEQYKTEMGQFSRTLVHHIDEIKKLDDAEFDKAANTLSEIVKQYSTHINKRRVHIRTGEHNEFTDIPEITNTIALLIVTSKLTKEKNIRRGAPDQQSLEAPDQSLSLVFWFIQELEIQILVQPVDFKKNCEVGPHQAEFLNYCKSLLADRTDLPSTLTAENRISINEESIVLYPRTQDEQLNLSITALKNAVSMTAYKEYAQTKGNPVAIAAMYKREYPKMLEEAYKLSTKNRVPPPPETPQGFRIRDKYEEYTYEDLKYLDGLNKYIDQYGKDNKFLSRDNYLLQYANVRKIAKPPIITKADPYTSKEANDFVNGLRMNPDSGFITDVGSKWHTHPESFFTDNTQHLAHDILQELVGAKFSDTSHQARKGPILTPAENAVRAQNLLITLAKHPELFKDKHIQEIAENAFFYVKLDSRLIDYFTAAYSDVSLELVNNGTQASEPPYISLTHQKDFDLLIKGIIPGLKKTLLMNKDARDQIGSSFMVHLMEALRDRAPAEQKHLFDEFFTQDGAPYEAIDYQLQFLTEISQAKGANYKAQKNEIATRLLEKAYKDLYLAAVPNEHMTDDFVRKVTTALAHFEESGGTFELKDPEATKRIIELKTLVYQKATLRMQEDPSYGQQLARSVSSSLMPDLAVSTFDWKVEGFPLFTATKGGKSYQLDIERGSLYSGGVHSETLPNFLRSHQDVSHLFADSLREPWMSQGTKSPVPFAKIFSYALPQNPNFRILVKDTLDQQNQSLGLPPKVRIEKLSDNNKNQWMSYRRFKVQDDKDATDLPAAIATVIGNKDCWISRDGTKMEITEGGKLFATLTIEREKNSQTLGKVTAFERADGKKMLLTNAVVAERFGRIARAESAVIYGKKGHPTHVEFPKLNLTSRGIPLSYTIKNNSIKSDAFEGYELAPLGEKLPKEALPVGFQSYHLLNADGKKKVLIPFSELQKVAYLGDEVRSTDKALRNETFAITETRPTLASQDLYEFNLNPETNQLEIYKPEGDAYLYLSYICFVNHDYKLAQTYLEKSQSFVPAFEKVQPILKMMKNHSDRSASGKAFMLKVMIREEVLIRKELQQQNILGKKSTLDVEDVQKRSAKIKELYHDYNQAKASPTSPLDEDFHLSEAEDRQILDFLKVTTEPSKIKDVKSAKVVNRVNPQDPISSYTTPLSAEILWVISGDKTSHKEGTLQSHEWLGSQFFKMTQDIIRLDKNSAEFKQLAANVRASLLTVQKQEEQKVQELEEAGFDQDQPVEAVVPADISTIQQHLQNLKAFRKDWKDRKEVGSQTSLEFLEQLILHKEAGRLDDVKPLDKTYRQSGNIITRFMKVAKLKLVCKLLGMDFDPLKPNSVMGDISRTELLNSFAERRKPVLETGSDGREKVKKISFKEKLINSYVKKQMNQLEKLIQDNAAKGDTVSAAEFVAHLRSLVLSKKDAAFLSKVDEVTQAMSRPVERSAAEIPPVAAAPLLESDGVDNPVDEILDAHPEASDPRHVINPYVTAEIEALEGQLRLQNPLSDKAANLVVTAKENKTPLLPKSGEPWEKAFTRIDPPAAPMTTKVLDKTGSPVQFLVDEHKKGLTEYQKTLDEKIYSVKESDVFAQQSEMEQMATALEAKRSSLKAKVDTLSDRFDTPIALTRLARETGQKTKPQLDDFLKLWMREELTVGNLNKLGVKISDSEVAEIDTVLCDYMKTVTEIGQLKRAQTASNDYLDSIKLLKFTGNPHLAKKYFDLLTSERHYALPTADHVGDPDYRKLLYMEYRLNFCLRENQLATFREMLANPNAVRQLDMGGGKTSVILPLLAEFKATGENLVTIVLPDALYDSVKKDIESRNRELFSKPFFCFEFNRDTDLSTETLQIQYHQMLETMEKRGFVLTKKAYNLNFLNTFKQLEYELSKDLVGLGDNEPSLELLGKIEQFRLMCKIGHLMKTRGQAIGDEIDLVSDVRQELNYALGAKEAIDPIKLNLGKDILLSCMSSKKGPLVKLWGALSTNSQATMTPQDKQAAIQELAKKQLKSLKLGDLDKAQLLNYVTDRNCDKYPDGFLELKNSDNPDEVELYQKIGTLRAFLTLGFPTALSKSCDTNFGRDPITNVFTIPYKASNTPSIGSEFDEEIERITYTLLDYGYKGFNKSQLLEYVQSCRSLAMKQQKNDMEDYPSISQTPAAKQFAEFIRKVDPKSEFSLSTDLMDYDHADKFDVLVSAINRTPESKINLCREIVLNQMGSLNSQIKSNSLDLASLFESYGGFTGTPWNRYTYADKMETIINEGVDGKTWQRLLSRPINVVVATHNPTDPIGMILGTGFVGKYQVLVDTGAYLKGKDNREFIEAVLAEAKAKGLPVDNGVYYNKANEIVCLEKGATSPVPISSAPVTDLKRRVNLYDQPHCTGADLPNDKQAKAIVTIGEDTFIRDLFQAVWRLRGLNEEQDVTFFMSDKVRDLIMDGKAGDPSVHEILEYALKIQGKREQEDNWRAEKEKISGTPGRMMTSILMEMGSREDVDLREFGKTIAVFGKHILQERNQEAMYDAYAELPILEDVGIVHEKAKAAAVNKIWSVEAELESLDLGIITQFAKTSEALQNRELKNKDRVAEKVSTSNKDVAQAGTEVHVETEQQQEQMTETQQEVAKELQLDNDKFIKEEIKEVYVGITDSDFEALMRDTVENKEHVKKSFHHLDNYVQSGFSRELYFSENYQNTFKVDGIIPAHKADVAIQLPNRKPILKVFALKRVGEPMKLVLSTEHDLVRAMQPFMEHTVANYQGQLSAAIVAITPDGPLTLRREGSFDPKSEELLPFEGEERAEFLNLYVQAKFFDGQTHYNKEEKAALKAWLEAGDAREIQFKRRYFEKTLVRDRAGEKTYSHSVLRNLFDLIEKEQGINVE